MARFMGIVQGSNGEASRLGGTSSGIRAQAQGWDVGVKVSGYAEDGRDVFHIYATRGSNGGDSSGFLIGVLTEEGGRLIFEPSPEVAGERGAYLREVA